MVENIDVDPGNLTTLAPYARHRSGPITYNNGLHEPSIGRPVYVIGVYDNYASTGDTVTLKNNWIIGVLDTTFAQVKILTNSFGTPFVDSSNNRKYEFWADADIQDSTYYIPELNGAMYHHGVAAPAFVATDYYGNPWYNPPSIGPVEYFDINIHNFWQGVYKVKIR